MKSSAGLPLHNQRGTGYDEIVNAIDDISMIGNAKAKEEAKEKLARYAPELVTVKTDLESTQKYIQTLESRLSCCDVVIEGKNAELNAKELSLY